MPPREVHAPDATLTAADVRIGPDLNPSRTALDHKLYRQILLPNGMRCVLIQDTIAMHQGGMGFGDGSGYESEDDASSVNDADDEENGNVNDEEEEEDGCDGFRDAAAALLVGAGSAMDPRGCEGLAHAIEHFLHMGSEKYPGENEYESYIAKHGGSDNAYTEWEYTVYTLSVQQDYLFGALDRLAQHFVAPLLSESSTERELNAVESEFQLNRHDDDNRREQLMCATAIPSHPFARFAWGNLKSLQDIPARLGMGSLTKLLRTFFDTHYYAANMRLVVMGAYTLDVLQQKVFDIFQHVPALPRNSSSEGPLPVDPETIDSWEATYTSPLSTAGPLFDKARALQKIFYVLPVKERHNLTITWQLPCMFSHWDSKPTDFLSHLLGHEAQGSLLSYLRKQGWATGCSAGLGDEGMEFASSHSLFSITFILSKTGLPHWCEIVKATYSYIGMLRMHAQNGWPEWIYEELKQIEEVSHQYADEESPDDLVETLAEEMPPCFPLPPERLLDGSSLFFRFDADEIRRILDDDMQPQNARIDFMSSSFGKYDDYEDIKVPEDATETIIQDLRVIPADDAFDPKDTNISPQIEPMFGTLFWCHEVSNDWIQEWNQAALPQEPSIDVALPPQNPFVPTRYDLKDLPSTDSRHPLVNSSIKVCTSVGKKKQWFQATVVRYDRNKNSVLLSYEDEEEQWHKLDHSADHFSRDKMKPGFEASLDNRKNKFRLLVLAKIGSGMIRSFGDSDDNEDDEIFPMIPPATPQLRLPKEISSSSLLRMWHLQDRNFHRPISDFRIQFICQHANESPLVRAVAELMSELVHDVCTETSYLASVCDIGSSIESLCIGFTMRFHGFDDKLLDLVHHVVPIFLSFRGMENSLPDGIPKSRFDACCEILCRKYKNQGLKSSKFCRNLRLQSLRSEYWSAYSKLQEIEKLDVPMFAKTASHLLSSFGAEVLYHGNVTDVEAKSAKNMIEKILKDSGETVGLSKKKYPPQTMLKMPMVKEPMPLVVPSKEHHDPNTAVEVYIQVGKDNLQDRVLIDLLINMMEEPFFDQLRTKDQFGYEVDCDVRWSYGIMGCVFRVVSNVKSAENIVTRIDKFLTEFRVTLVEMDSTVYMEHLVALASQKLEMFNSMSEETDSYWSEIADGRYQWQVWRDEAICLRGVMKEDVLKAFDKWLHPETKRRMLVVQVIGNGETNSSKGRPVVEQDELGEYALTQVTKIRASCKNQTWGRINSKLF
eukprot:scaffold2204_cov166-Amphora_coffeaeformis.AAC.26